MVITYLCRVWINGKVANPARGQLKRGKKKTLSLFAPEIWPSETRSVVSFRFSLLIFICRLNLELTHGISPDFRAASIYLFKPA